MIRTRNFFIALCFLLLWQGSLLSQEIPPIVNYNPVDYGAVNQNWAVSQGEGDLIYVANNSGLLVFDGERWENYPSPNGSNMRAVEAVEGRIYTGNYMEFGYWEPLPTGAMQYHSLVEELPEPMIEGEEVWNILAVGDWILFQSLHRIYAFNPDNQEFRLIPARNKLARMYRVGDSIYFQREGEGVFRIEGGKAVLLSADPALLNAELAGLFRMESGMLLLTGSGAFYSISETGKVSRNLKFQLPEGVRAYSSRMLSSGQLAVGTISSGIFLFAPDGTLAYTLQKSNGLNNNTVLGLFEDGQGNLWGALDNGISVVNMNSPFREYNDPDGRLGVVYTSVQYQGNLYLGTNQGLFYKPVKSNGEFRFVPGTRGQVWKLKVINGSLLCGHNNGTYQILGEEAVLIADIPGTWDFTRIPGRDNLILQGNYQGLSVLEYRLGKWTLRNKVEGFEVSSRFLEFANEDTLLVSHEFKGIYILRLEEGLQQVEVVKELPPMGIGTSLFSFKDQLLYASDSGIFFYNNDSLNFDLHEAYTKSFQDLGKRPVGIMIPDQENDRVWGFGNESLDFLSIRTLDGQPELNSVAIPEAFRRELGVLGFENIAALGENTYLIGKSNGYILLDVAGEEVKASGLLLRRVYRDAHTGERQLLARTSPMKLEYGANNLEFLFSAPEYHKYTEVLYRYRMPGLFEAWSPWTNEAEAGFENLPYGDFELEVQARVGQDILSNDITYGFTIGRPWYLSNLAIVIYTVGLTVFFLLVHRSYRAYYRKKEKRIKEQNRRELKRKKLKAKKEVIQIRNEKLSQEIESKNRELAVSTMSLIKKNEFLGKIKEELRKVKDPKEINSVIRTIDRNINNSDDWKFFEEAFNNADKDFLKKIQDRHPELTPNDLKLCAYLRLNLSSKEIAPLLNISVRSVEVKRYRLRKKMDLPHETGLTDYILSI